MNTQNKTLEPLHGKYLYHATYKPLLASIIRKGLDTSKSKKSWEDSIPGYVYLATDPYIAISYAETSEYVPDEWLDEIIVLTIDSTKLDPNRLFIDSIITSTPKV